MRSTRFFHRRATGTLLLGAAMPALAAERAIEASVVIDTGPVRGVKASLSAGGTLRVLPAGHQSDLPLSPGAS